MDYKVLLGRFGHVVPSEPESQAVILGVLEALSGKYKVLDSIQTDIQATHRIPLGRFSYGGSHFDANRTLEARFREENPATAVYVIRLRLLDGRAYCLFFFASTGEAEVIREDVRACLPVRSQEDRYLHQPKQPSTFGPDSDIRDVLGCRGYKRSGLLLASSPGWDQQHANPNGAQAKSKNAGRLEATINDCNAFFQVVLALTPDDVLPGGNFLGIVRTRTGLLGLLDFFSEGQEAIVEHLWDKNAISGYVLTDAKVGSIDINTGSAGRVLTRPGGCIVGRDYAFRPESRLMSPDRKSAQTESERFPVPYSLVFYSGHGSESGNIQIEPDKTVTPEELVKWGMRSQTFLVVVVDMCHAAAFGRRFADELEHNGWQGIAICANDSRVSGGLAFESQRMYGVRHHPILPVAVDMLDVTAGYGVFTTAFCLAMVQLREAEIQQGVRLRVSFEQFVRGTLTDLCKVFARTLAVPAIRPVLFSHNT